ncbi:DUF2278 family protein [Chryseobacterium gambrini]|uniref:DUF2278 family protein n=1 Tax=Chryseobacterium gambrini TaxID=373672 RepID=UPI003D12F377
MPLKHYHIFAGRYDRGMMAQDANHFEIKLDIGGDFYRIAVNVRSQDGSMLLSYVDENFQHEICSRILSAFPNNGVYDINTVAQRKQFGLDFLRRNMVGDFNNMIPLPNNMPRLDNDLEDKLRLVLDKTKADPQARIFIFGEKWKSTDNQDRYFPEIKDQGLHDIHMNQGNKNSHEKDNGVFQDGGLLIYFPSLGRWTVVLLAFQSQFNTLNPNTLHTDDTTGHRIKGTDESKVNLIIDNNVVIIAALVNPKGEEKGNEKILLLNTTNTDISLKKWKLADRNNQTFEINNNSIKAFGTEEIIITTESNFNPGNSGGTITLLNSAGLKIHGVQYTKDQAKDEDRLIKF